MNKVKTASLNQLKNKLDMASDTPFELIEANDHITIGLYRPQQPDRQSPHKQDEYYFVASGSADINVEGDLSSLLTGDAVFVPANANHAFENVSSDFHCWAIFYGPET